NHLAIDPSRVEFIEFQPREKYLQTYNRIDICLDTFPYNGHTTTLDALWMAVPVISLCGETAVSRAGLSLMRNLGLSELVARDAAMFSRIAVELAGDLSRLAMIRSSLREKMHSSPMMDAQAFARDIESAYHEMWQRWLISIQRA
ncbi:MAG TPA: hypothetical protein VHS31_00470, partial [Tepidisphaeraceae bacterium]|nr:hypothetical protein [Tepidisphaeraceae bacterium]